MQVASALRTAGQHKKTLEQAQRMEQEFLSLVTGQRSVDGSVADSEGGGETEGEESTRVSPRGLVHVCSFTFLTNLQMRRFSSTARLTAVSIHTYVVHGRTNFHH